MQTGFPTIGAVTRFLFNAAGVLAQKDDSLGLLLSEKDKKSLQTRLKRLTDEDGELEENLNDVLSLLMGCVDRISPSPRVTAAIAESIWDLLVQYSDLVRGEGTYLGVKDTLGYVLKSKLVGRVVVSSQKNVLRFNLKDLGLSTPEGEYWFLPDIYDDCLVWPLEKAMRWAYSVADTSQTHFHFPGKNAKSESFQLSQNLESAENWLHARSLPNWGVLHTNLMESFAAMEACSDSQHQRQLPESTQAQVVLVVFIARAATYITQEIDRHYGRDVLLQLLDQFKEQSQVLRSDVHAHMSSTIEKLIGEASTAKGSPPQEVIDRIWRDSVPQYWWDVGRFFAQAGEETQSFLLENHGEPLTQEQLTYIERRYGPYFFTCLKHGLEISESYPMPQGFMELVVEGEGLLNRNSSLNQVRVYKERVEKSSWSTALSWLAEWNEGSLHMRNGDQKLAHKHLGNAFGLGKYCAGDRQKPLVQGYLEVCAKVQSWKDFKKAFAWARYLQIPVRLWDSEWEESMENVKTLYTMYLHMEFV